MRYPFRLFCLVLDRVMAQLPCASVALFYLSLRLFVCSILNRRAAAFCHFCGFNHGLRSMSSSANYFAQDVSTGNQMGQDVDEEPRIESSPAGQPSEYQE
jgi:hypothetical protein